MSQINKKWLEGVGQALGLAELDAQGKVPAIQLPEFVNSEAGLREAADAALDARLEVLEADPVTKAYVDGADAGLQSQITQEVAARQAAVQSEQEARVAGDANLLSQINMLISGGMQEMADRQAADTALSGRISVLEADPTTKSYVDGLKVSLDGDISAEEAARIAGDASVLAEAKGYADQKIVDLKGGVSAGYDTLKKIEDKIEFITSNVDGAALDSLSEIVAAFQAADGTINGAIQQMAAAGQASMEAEMGMRQAADSALDARLDVLELDPVTKGFVEAADAGLQSAITSEQSARVAGDANLQGQINTLISGGLQEISDRQSADSALSARISVLEADPVTKSYVDEQIPDSTDGLVEGSSNLYFTGARAKAAAVVNSMSGSESDMAPSVLAIKNYISGLPQPTRIKEKYTLNATDIANGYVTLGHLVLSGTEQVFVNRLAMHGDEDYSLSTVGGVTRITFSGEVAHGHISELEVGDVIRVTYMY